MIDDEYKITRQDQASLVSIVSPKFPEHSKEEETLRSLEELHELLRTLGIKRGSQYIQNKKSIDAATILGSGKLEEIARSAKAEGSKLLVFDFELTAGQIRNIKKLTGLDILDRNHIILEIFAEHAQTREARNQIEISRLEYLLPRLAGLWEHFSRQKGGVGIMGGEGEQQIELDRRIISKRIVHLKKDLTDLKKSRIEQSKKRKNQTVTAALVGYTNAGKSSLMNRLCRVDVLEEDKLFATLDSTFRTLNPDTKPPMLLIDTVGFISNLPATLVNGFKTTLESSLEADFLLIVCDISSPHYKKHLEVTLNILSELNIENKEQIIVFNKKDKVDPMKASIIKKSYPGSFLVSSFNEEDIDRLRNHIIQYFLDKQDHYELFIPYEEGVAHSMVVAKTNVIASSNHEKGIFYKVCAPDFIFNPLNLKKFKTEEKPEN